MERGNVSVIEASPMPHEVRQLLSVTRDRLEKDLRTLLKSREPGRRAAQDELRESIRNNYCQILRTDPQFAADRDIEQSLWRLVFYKRFDELRGRLKSTPGSASIKTELSEFLEHAKSFYGQLLAEHLRIARITRTDNNTFVDELETSSSPSRSAASIMALALMTCARCLVYLGDLERYWVQHCGDERTQRRSYSSAQSYYEQALQLLPGSGNPHNQMAVVATYVDLDLLAVHHYFRSLAVEKPFVTARQNLRQLFQSNKPQVAKRFQETSQLRNIGDVKTVKLLLVRLLGLLHKSSADEAELYKPLKDALLEAIPRVYLVAPSSPGHSPRRSSTSTDIRARRTSAEESLHLLASSICCVHNSVEASKTNSSGRSSVVSEVAARLADEKEPASLTDEGPPLQSELTLRNLCWIFDYVCLLVRLTDSSRTDLLRSVKAFCDWLCCHPDFIMPSAHISGDAREEYQSRALFWESLATMLNRLENVDDLKVPAGDISGVPPLPEELSLRGFVHLKKAYGCVGRDFFAVRRGEGSSTPPPRQQYSPAELHRLHNAIRYEKIRGFALEVGVNLQMLKHNARLGTFSLGNRARDPLAPSPLASLSGQLGTSLAITAGAIDYGSPAASPVNCSPDPMQNQFAEADPEAVLWHPSGPNFLSAVGGVAASSRLAATGTAPPSLHYTVTGEPRPRGGSEGPAISISAQHRRTAPASLFSGHQRVESQPAREHGRQYGTSAYYSELGPSGRYRPQSVPQRPPAYGRSDLARPVPRQAVDRHALTPQYAVDSAGRTYAEYPEYGGRVQAQLPPRDLHARPPPTTSHVIRPQPTDLADADGFSAVMSAFSPTSQPNASPWPSSSQLAESAGRDATSVYLAQSMLPPLEPRAPLSTNHPDYGDVGPPPPYHSPERLFQSRLSGHAEYGRGIFDDARNPQPSHFQFRQDAPQHHQHQHLQQHHLQQHQQQQVQGQPAAFAPSGHGAASFIHQGFGNRQGRY